MSKLAKALTAAAGNAGGDNLYVEDVFSTYLYTGNSANQNIVNGIDLAGEGGMVWTKRRDNSQLHGLFDTERGVLKYISSDRTDAETTKSNTLKAFNSDGFQLGYESYPTSNSNGEKGVSWTFRKAEKFFDVVTWTGTGVAGRTVAHNLGSVPACMIVKRTNAAQGWAVYHVGMDATNPENWMMRLNATDARFDLTPSRWNDTAPTSTEFTLSDNDEVNGSGDTYVAYLFASDAGGFGDDGSENIIKCGSFSGSATNIEIDCGFEPQWILIKSATNASDWYVVDVMRGMSVSDDTVCLSPNLSGAENTDPFSNIRAYPTATGFVLPSGGSYWNTDPIYIAIRRPMKTPESGTEVFSPSTYAGNDPTPTVITTGFPVDLALTAYRDLANAGAFGFTPRLTEAYLYSATTAAEVATGLAFDSNTSFATDANHWNQSPSNLIGYGFKRATGFFDVVAYTGTGSNTSINHNLGVAPELMIVKRRNSARVWAVWASGIDIDDYLTLNGSSGVATFSLWQSTQPTATQITLGTDASVNGSGDTYIGYLFATLAGVSKVGSYTGTGADLNVDCGFSAGARFILIKRTDSTGDWYVWDSVRGIVAGNDPYLLLNSTAAEVTSTDYIDPLNAGFTVTSSAPAALNASGGTYIFLAIA